MVRAPLSGATQRLDNLLDGIEASVIEAADEEILGDTVEAPALRAAAIRHMMQEWIRMTEDVAPDVPGGTVGLAPHPRR